MSVLRKWMCLLLLCAVPLQGIAAWTAVHCAHALHSPQAAASDLPMASDRVDARAPDSAAAPCEHCTAAHAVAFGDGAAAVAVLTVPGALAVAGAEGHADDPITRLERVPLFLPTSPP
jgi:hypothetical protein